MMRLLPRRSLFLLLSCLPLLLIGGGCASHSSLSSADTATMGRLMAERLGWMKQVARVKQARHLPVTDAKREAEVLTAMVQQGTDHGLPKAAVKAFFNGQMQAAREQQLQWMKMVYHPELKKGEPMPDLAKTVRPALDAIGQRMIVALTQARASGQKEEILAAARRLLTEKGYVPQVTEPALRGLEAGLAE
jgi:chorismate mutase-like protein